jgi:hypothetical protein
LSARFEEALEAFSTAMLHADGFGVEREAEIHGFIEGLNVLLDGASSALPHIVEFRTIVERLPRATREFGRARGELSETLNLFETELNKVVALATVALENARRMLR